MHGARLLLQAATCLLQQGPQLRLAAASAFRVHTPYVCLPTIRRRTHGRPHHSLLPHAPHNRPHRIVTAPSASFRPPPLLSTRIPLSPRLVRIPVSQHADPCAPCPPTIAVGQFLLRHVELFSTIYFFSNFFPTLLGRRRPGQPGRCAVRHPPLRARQGSVRAGGGSGRSAHMKQQSGNVSSWAECRPAWRRAQPLCVSHGVHMHFVFTPLTSFLQAMQASLG